MGSVMPSPAPKPWANVVLPAPRGPESSNTSPPCTIPATRRPSSCMASLVGAAIVCSLINTPLSTFTDLYD